MLRKNIPFDFVFDYLIPLEVIVKPMFGMFAIYSGEKIMLLLRQRKDHPESNGVWIATSQEHHKSLRQEFPSLCSIAIYADVNVDTEWQMLPQNAADFESSVIKVCQLIVKGDPRMGRIPTPRKKRETKKPKTR